MLTELERVTLVAITAGFLSGSLQSILDYALQTELKKQIVTLEKFFNKLLFLSLTGAVLFGAGVFVYAIWDTSMSASQLNEFSLALAAIVGLMPILEKFLGSVFSQAKKP